MNGRPWSLREEKALRANYAHRPTKEIAQVLRRSVESVYGHAHLLGLEKDPKFVLEQNRELGRRLNLFGAAHRFPPGHVPANKGLRRPGYSAGRMKETQFKKGQRTGAANNNWLPVGTVQPNGDGYLRRKIADLPESIAGKGASSKNWEFVHRRVWEDAHGPIPPGYRIWWKDGNHMNCALENLELLSGKEHVARTTVHNLPKALVEVIQLKAALQRRINRRSKADAQKQNDRPAQPSV